MEMNEARGGSEGERSVLLISDMAGYGKVALSVMIPVLSHLRSNVYNLPTALVSNTLDYGRFHILETTDYMRRTLDVWDDLGFTFDAVFAGFLFSEEQSKLVTAYCQRLSDTGVPVFVDPIMGDWGSLYNGVSEADVAYRRRLCAVADVIMPNMTEAEYLCGEHVGERVVSKSDALDLVSGLREMGAKDVVITSMDIEGSPCTLISPSDATDIQLIQYDEVPVQMPGTGDISSSVLMGRMLSGSSLEESVRSAMDVVANLLCRCVDAPDRSRGIPVETHLADVLSEEMC